MRKLRSMKCTLKAMCEPEIHSKEWALQKAAETRWNKFNYEKRQCYDIMDLDYDVHGEAKVFSISTAKGYSVYAKFTPVVKKLANDGHEIWGVKEEIEHYIDDELINY